MQNSSVNLNMLSQHPDNALDRSQIFFSSKTSVVISSPFDGKYCFMRIDRFISILYIFSNCKDTKVMRIPKYNRYEGELYHINID